MAYFHPWVIREEDARLHVTTFTNLVGSEHGVHDPKKKWRVACATWLNGNVLTQEKKHTIQNLFAVTRARPNDIEIERNNSDEELSDNELDIETIDLEELLITHPGGRRYMRERTADDNYVNAFAAIAHAQSI